MLHRTAESERHTSTAALTLRSRRQAFFLVAHAALVGSGLRSRATSAPKGLSVPKIGKNTDRTAETSRAAVRAVL